MKRIFLIVLDSFGVGELPDAKDFGDEGSNTLAAVTKSPELCIPNMKKLGLYNISGCSGISAAETSPSGAYGRCRELSRGKDTTTGHWEIGGLVSEKPFPTFPEGFPPEIITEFENKTGRKVICNKPYSGTDVIRDYGHQHIMTGDLIVYTSADSVFQIAAHEDVVPVEELYKYCQIARDMLKGKYAVGRVIARPFTGDDPDFVRTVRRHDFSLTPPTDTMLDLLMKNGIETYGIGKINDIFAGKGISSFVRTTGNADGMAKTDDKARTNFEGLCFVNLVDFDMLYGHRNDVPGYAKALTQFDIWLGNFEKQMLKDDLLIITSDHGCDPSTPSTDHSREHTLILAYGDHVKPGTDLLTRSTFADISATVLEYFGVENTLRGESFLGEMTDNV
jgi:phosphopentomutase